MDEMPYQPDSTEALDILMASPFFGRLDRAARAEISDDLALVSLAKGEALFRQGDAGDSMYILDRGLLVVQAALPDGTTRPLDRLDAGAAVGEMALLTGQPRTADVVALVESRLLRFPRAAFDRLAERHPPIAAGFALAIAPRVQRIKLAEILTRVFGDLELEELHDLQNQVIWRRLVDGEVLLRQGEVGRSMYIVVSGRLQIVHEPPGGGKERPLGEIGAGETVGEFALLTDEPRSATIVATRVTDVVELTRPVFDELVRRHPRAMREVARIIVQRQQRALRDGPGGGRPGPAMALLAAGGSAATLREDAERLHAALAELGPVALLTSEGFDALYGKRGAAQMDLDDALSIVLNSWMQELERHYRFILYVADDDWSNWTQRCLAQSDRVVLLARAADDPDPNVLEQFCNPRLSRELVLVVEDGGERPPEMEETAAWLAGRVLAAHHLVHTADDWRRIAGRLAGGEEIGD